MLLTACILHNPLLLSPFRFPSPLFLSPVWFIGLQATHPPSSPHSSRSPFSFLCLHPFSRVWLAGFCPPPSLSFLLLLSLPLVSVSLLIHSLYIHSLFPMSLNQSTNHRHPFDTSYTTQTQHKQTNERTPPPRIFSLIPLPDPPLPSLIVRLSTQPTDQSSVLVLGFPVCLLE